MRSHLVSLIAVVGIFILALSGCTAPLITLPCYDLPGTEETCDNGNPAENPQIKLDWLCDECVSVRQGFAPLVVSFWVAGINPDPNSPVLWEIEALNSGIRDSEFTKPEEQLNYTFETEDVYVITATYKNINIDPIEIRVDVNEVEANWSTPWIRGELCDARIHMLADPEINREVPYFIEVIVKRVGLEAITIRDWVPYRLRYPEHVHGHRIAPHKSPDPYKFPAQLEPQVIRFDGAGMLNFVWDVDVKCIHPNRFEELKITTRL